MNIAITCHRPYQVFNIVRLILSGIISTDNNYDLYLQDLPAHNIIKNSLKESGLFKNIYTIQCDESQPKFWVKVKRFLEHIFLYRYYLKTHDISGIKHSYKYDIIMSSTWTHYFVKLASVNPSADIYMFDDGLGSYFGDERIRWLSMWCNWRIIFYKLLSYFLHRDYFSIRISRLYVNRPELVIIKSFEVHRIPILEKANICIMKKIFNYKKPQIYAQHKKIIFLSQNTQIRCSILGFDDFKMCSALKRIKEKTIIRPHPKYPFTPLGFDIDTSEVSWELLASDLDDYIFITNFSSAIFTPDMLYENKRFTLILLYKIMNMPGSFKHLDKFIISFRKINPNIYVPETFEEYKAIIKKLVP